MKAETLKFISDSLENLEINYSFMQWTRKPAYPYFVGEYQETPILNEDGMQESTFILNGYGRGSFIELEEAKEKIRGFFKSVEGKIVIAESGSAMAIFYGNSITVQTVDAELKRIQINLTIKEWSVN